MPRLDGIAATRRIAGDAGIRTRVVILTTFEQDDYVFQALRAGASGFLLKNAPPEQLVEAVRTVAAGDALLAPAITRRVIQDYARRSAPRRDDARVELLTERELERAAATAKLTGARSEVCGSYPTMIGLLMPPLLARKEA
jgi:DNA-binding NarL/FixJ family response regulator